MTQITYFTDKQLEIERIISGMGFRVKAEQDIEQYRADLVIEELQMICEIDGPSHRKVKPTGELITLNSNKKSKRDELLLRYYPNGVFHIPVSIEGSVFEKEFQKAVNSLSGK